MNLTLRKKRKYIRKIEPSLVERMIPIENAINREAVVEQSAFLSRERAIFADTDEVAKEEQKIKEESYVVKELREYCKGKTVKDDLFIKLDLQGFNFNNDKNYWYLTIGSKCMFNQIYKNYDLSCGHRQFTNLSFDVIFRGILTEFKPEYHKDILNGIYNILFKFIKKELKCQFILVSDNNHTEKSFMHGVLESLKRWDTSWELNPNSLNTIKMWII